MPDRPQVIIRIVPDGGTRTLQQIINQLEYLSRKGKLELQRSARHLDIPVPPDQIAELARSWVQETGVYDESQPDERREQELTTHIIVSFPPGTGRADAYAASREWAAEMFGSGNGGGRYNYLTAFHVDRDHPHLHVVVNRRELLGREWLKISRRHPHLNYEALRMKMAEISLRHGIVLDASSRAERGILERPMTYAQFRRLERQASRVRFDDADTEQGSPREDHPLQDQPVDTLPPAGPSSKSKAAVQPSVAHNASPVPLLESAGFVPAGNLGDDAPNAVRDGACKPRDNSGVPGTANQNAVQSPDTAQENPKRRRDDAGEPSGAKGGRSIATEPETTAREQNDRNNPATLLAAPPRSLSLNDTARSGSATDSLPAVFESQQQRPLSSKRALEDEAPGDRKRARDGSSQDRRRD
ncbi:UNVERIFIED_ORG: type IV secretion system T-DNA border endonuclease VirD2 [Rhizobium etli]|uniref:T-DNA border endonuclease, VirD2 protein n=2 Tax=Rhizobium TaxID=379 RepID=Q2K2F5_RHIEC|nr:MULTISPECIES: T-DNA border endonuclease VirD2 [Rhizobium]ABC92934.1 T-DNA border endonuclease, VirD2 protein [Rhizobium etli CFN 42]PDT19188.1 type IV secretion system protein VirD [Rhizobium hidalgonense]PON04191.1 type IV secretion system protein VirD [Rhizobium hidalgonense]UWU38999.1 T-DNA border endonuclease VirD2 [Rhizobium leguminosarum bv. phaseoli]